MSHGLPVPPNGIWLYDNVFVDETEICNIHFLEYLHYMWKDDSVRSQLPFTPIADQLSWNIAADTVMTTDWIDGTLDTLSTSHFTNEDNYFQYPRYRYFPVVGISHRQAQDYCVWRSRAVNEKYNQDLAAAGKPYRVYFNFRLPTEEEWEMAARGRNPQNKYGLPADSIEVKGKLRRNTRSVIDYAVSRYKPAFTSMYFFKMKNNAYPFYLAGLNFIGYIYGDHAPNDMGLYHMVGNVAEMIDRDSIAKGGSWQHMPEECEISKRQYYECPTTWLGFRCVCDVYVYKAGESFTPPAIALASEHCPTLLEAFVNPFIKLRAERDKNFTTVPGHLTVDSIALFINDSLSMEYDVSRWMRSNEFTIDVRTHPDIVIDSMIFIRAECREGYFSPKHRITFVRATGLSLQTNPGLFDDAGPLGYAYIFDIRYTRAGKRGRAVLKRSWFQYLDNE
jgi:hypothetical protein